MLIPALQSLLIVPMITSKCPFPYEKTKFTYCLRVILFPITVFRAGQGFQCCFNPPPLSKDQDGADKSSSLCIFPCNYLAKPLMMMAGPREPSLPRRRPRYSPKIKYDAAFSIPTHFEIMNIFIFLQLPRSPFIPR